MVIYRNNQGRALPLASSDDRLAVIQRHHAPATPTAFSPPDINVATRDGDVIYGAKAIAVHLFGCDDNRTRRRVFNLWTHYRDRKEKAGFFKLKGALCLSKLQWRLFHGLENL